MPYWAAAILTILALVLSTRFHNYFELAVVFVLLLLVGSQLLTIRHERRLRRELLQLNDEANRALAEGNCLREMGKEISEQVDVTALLELITGRARELLRSGYAGVVSLDEATGGHVWLCTVGFRSVELRNLSVPAGKGLAGRAIAGARPVAVEDFEDSIRLSSTDYPVELAEQTRSGLAVPLVRGERVLGAIVVGYREDRQFGEGEIGLLTALASHAAIALENSRLYGAERQRVAELEAVFDHISDGVIVTDGQGVVVRFNDAATRLLGPLTVGARIEELGARGGIELEDGDGEAIPSNRWPMVMVARGECFKGKEVVVKHHDGRPRHLSVDGCPIDGEASDLELGIVVLHDVTALREMDLLKDEFLSLAAHELKTPLTTLKGYSQILLATSGESLGTRQKKALEMIDRQANRINRMVEQFVNVAEMRSQGLSLHMETVDLSTLIEATCARLGASAGRELVCRIAGPVQVIADPKSLDLVLSNLVHNAVKFSPDGSPVEVDVAVVGGEAVVSVRDAGVGIPLEKQRRLFERFYQVEPGLNSQGGIGLGLYISQELVSNQDGRMWLESREGEGSTFYFALPVAASYPCRSNSRVASG